MIRLYTTDPQDLLSNFDAAVEKGGGAGSITTWEKINNDYTHKAADWKKCAYFRPFIEDDALVFGIIKNVGSNVSVSVYAYYHGHLLETFLRHFDKDFTESFVSALALTPDLVSR